MLDDYAPRIETELADQPDIRASLQRTVGLAYLSQSRLTDAERYLNAALETHLKLYGENHQETAATYVGLASVSEAKADFAAAVDFLQKAITIYRRQPPTEAAHLKNFAGALNLMGDVYWTKGDFETADAAFNESLSLALRLEDGSGEYIANAKRGLGLTRYAQGRFDEATVLLGEAIGEFRKLPHLRWKLPDALNFLAQTLMWKSIDNGTNDFDEALKYLKESERLSFEIWGENNFWYPRSLWLQAYVLCLKDECAAAEKVLNRAEEINDRYFPDNKVTKANLFDARCLILTRTRRAAEGENFGRRAVGLYQSSANSGAPSVTIARIHLAGSLSAQKKYAEAETVLEKALKDSSEAQGARHWRTLEVERQLTDLHKIWRKPAQPD
jgi:serine/threonine-protein kinase